MSAAARSPRPTRRATRFGLLTDFSNWSEYVADFPPVLLVRVTPRLVEGFWTMVGRGAAQTQGMSLPAVKHFKSGFSRMRVFCGVTEVAPVHPFILEQRISDNDPIHEGLYVFDPATLTPQCGSVRITLYSEKDPQRAMPASSIRGWCSKSGRTSRRIASSSNDERGERTTDPDSPCVQELARIAD